VLTPNASGVNTKRPSPAEETNRTSSADESYWWDHSQAGFMLPEGGLKIVPCRRHNRAVARPVGTALLVRRHRTVLSDPPHGCDVPFARL